MRSRSHQARSAWIAAPGAGLHRLPRGGPPQPAGVEGEHHRRDVRTKGSVRGQIAQLSLTEDALRRVRKPFHARSSVGRGGSVTINVVHAAWHARLAATPPVHNARAVHTAPPTNAPRMMGRLPEKALVATYMPQARRAPARLPTVPAATVWTTPRHRSSSPPAVMPAARITTVITGSPSPRAYRAVA